MGVQDDQPSAVRWAAEHLRRKYNKPGNVYVGVVSRLDAMASGVLVFARTSKAASRLSEQIRQQTTTKQYLALVEGRLEVADRSTTLVDFLRKNDDKHRIEIVRPEASEAQRAELTFQTLLNCADTSVLDVRLLTGRKHQIRVQLAAIEHPIVGDRKYGSNVLWKLGIGLHCFSNTIEHPTLKRRMTFSSLPRHWQANLGASNFKLMCQIIQDRYRLDCADAGI